MSTVPTAASDALAVRLSPSTHRRSARPVDDVSTTLRGLIRQLRAVARRPHRSDAGQNDVIDLPDLVHFQDMARAADAALHQAVRHLIGLGYSWSEIGAALGMTKQSAHQRFSR